MADMLYAASSGNDIADQDHGGDFFGAAAAAAAAGGAVPPAANVGGFGPVAASAAGGLVGPAGMYNNANQAPPRPRFPGLYVGNLTWWTTDRDVMDAINSIGVSDVQEVKFFENRNNGQSKGFCVVTFSSDTSLPIVMEKLPAKELHGQHPVVAPYNRQNLNLFETQNKMIRPPMNSTNGPTPHAAGIMGINSISGVHAATGVANPQLATAVAANIPYANVASAAGAGAVGFGYNQAAMGISTLGGGPGAGGQGGLRPLHGAASMRMQMRGPRPMIGARGPMNNGLMMGRMNNRFMSPQNWNNSQAGGGGGAGGGFHNSANRPQMGMDISNRLGGLGAGKQDDPGTDMHHGSSSYYNSHHHSNSHQSDHYSSRSDIRDHRDHHHQHHHHRDLRDVRDRDRGLDDRPSRPDDRSSRHDDRLGGGSRGDDRLGDRLGGGGLRDDRLSSRDRSSRLMDDRGERSRRSPDLRSSSRKFEVDDRGSSSRRGGGAISSDHDTRRDRDDRSSRHREERSSASSSSRHHRSHRSDERARSRSRSKDRSRASDSKSERRSERDRDSKRERY